MIDLNLEDLLYTAERVLGDVVVRDMGLLESALARPRATAFGEDVYPELRQRAAALVHSIARNHALVDGNKRLALGALIAVLALNGERLAFTNDEAYDFIYAISTGELDDVAEIAERLRLT